jgi:recombination protein RecA
MKAASALTSLAVRGVQRGLSAPPSPAGFGLAAFAGRLAEISGRHGGAPLTLVFRLVLEAQQRSEPVAWIGRGDSVFFPPDAAEAGVDLDALPVILAPDSRMAARAADHLVRSGGFGLVVLDIGEDDRLPRALLARLAGLASKHGTALLCVTEKDARRPSLGSLVSLRAEAVRRDEEGGRFRCEVRVLKDKRHGPGGTHLEVCHGPDGLC